MPSGSGHGGRGESDVDDGSSVVRLPRWPPAGLRLGAALLLAAGCRSSEVATRDLVTHVPAARVEANDQGARPWVDADAGSLHLPGGSRVAFDLRLGPGSRLELDGLQPAGTDAGQLVVRIAADGKGEAVLGSLEAPVGRRAVRVPPRWHGIARLSLEAVFASDGLVRVVRPAVREATADRPAMARRHPGRPNVIVYLIDTLRADSLGCYGAASAASPHIDALAADGIVFDRVVAESSWTRASVASLFTGLPAHVHGVAGRSDALAEDAHTMAELFRDGGWATAAFVTNGNVAALYGFAQGFDLFDLLPGTRLPTPKGAHPTTFRDPPSADVTERALRWLDTRADARPFFLYLHTIDPHSPYDPPAEYRRRFGVSDEAAMLGSLDALDRMRRGLLPQTTQVIRSLYDAEVAFNDHHLGRFLDALRERGLYDDAVIIVLSDHGEEFLEHGSLEHGRTVYGEVTHVPLVVKLPRGEGVGGRREARVVQLADVLPTLADYANLPGRAAVRGSSFLAAQPLGPMAKPRTAYAGIDLDGFRAHSVTEGRWTLIRTGGGRALHDRRRDPAQHVDVSAARPITSAYLAAQLDAALADARPRVVVPAPEPSEDVRRNLQALGYIE